MKIILGTSVSIPPFSPGRIYNRFHYVEGFRRLGHDVYYVENIEPEGCVDNNNNKSKFKDSVNVKIFRETMKFFDLEDNACLIYDNGRETEGMSIDSLTAITKETDLLVNMSGHIKNDFILDNIPYRIYLDEDPVYTQLWHDEYNVDLNFDRHNIFVTKGLNVGTEYCPIPTCRRKWHHTLPAVVTELWPHDILISEAPFTTIASMYTFGDLCYKGTWYKSKYEEFEKFAELPHKIGSQDFEISLNMDSLDHAGTSLLKENGWRISSSKAISDFSSYRQFISNSRAEIGIAKNAYVISQSGWFSDRSATYLSNGKPVLAQSTGFERYLPTGTGLLTFRTMEEAIAGVEEINTNYEKHCRAAREIANEYLDYSKVIPMLLETTASLI